MKGDWGEDVRHADLPRHKEVVMSRLFGEVVGWLTAQGLTKGKEFEARNQQVLQCSKKVIWIDGLNPDKQITWVFNSIRMMVEFGVVSKPDKMVTHRETLTDLRYQISTGSEIELTDGGRSRFNAMFKSFEGYFKAILA